MCPAMNVACDLRAVTMVGRIVNGGKETMTVRSALRDTEVEFPKNSNSAKGLLVFVHGMNGQKNRDKIRQLVRNPQEFLGGSNKLTREIVSQSKFALLMPTYNCSKLSREDPFVLAAELQWLIHKRVQEHGFKEVVLSGHSMGAALVRKATVYGLGQLDDHPYRDLGEEHHWSWAAKAGSRPGKLARLVLMAGLNRG